MAQTPRSAGRGRPREWGRGAKSGCSKELSARSLCGAAGVGTRFLGSGHAVVDAPARGAAQNAVLARRPPGRGAAWRGGDVPVEEVLAELEDEQVRGDDRGDHRDERDGQARESE